MPNWKKVILSGSNAHINNLTASGHVSALDNGFTINNHDSTELLVEGNITASNISILNTASITYFETTYQSSSIIFSSGSTKFGDTLDDTHTFTGSLFITGITYDNTPQPAAAVLTIDTASGRLYYTGSYGGGGGSTSTLQQVTDQGSSTTTAITASIISASSEVITATLVSPIIKAVGHGNNNFTIKDEDGDALFSVDGKLSDTDVVITMGDPGESGNSTQIKLTDSNKSIQLGINANTHVTASGNISGSGALFASLSFDDSNFNTVMYHQQSGKFFYTGSYGGGGGGEGGNPGGVVNSIQYNDGNGGFDGESAFQYDENTNTLSLSNNDGSKTQGLSSPDSAANLYTGKQVYYLAEKSTPTGIFGIFDKLNKYLCLQPPTQNGAQTTTTSAHEPSSRLHVLDDPTDNSGVIAKIINQNNKGKYNLLLGTAVGPGTIQGAHKFISFHALSGNDGGTELNGGLLYDPNSNVFGIPQSSNTVIFQGITVQSSDKKLKKHITFTKKSIDDIMSIKVKDFRWKEQLKDTPKNTGFIAQDLLETHPEMIRNIDGTLNVEYDKMIPLLVKAIQDQQHQIDDLKEQLKNKQL